MATDYAKELAVQTAKHLKELQKQAPKFPVPEGFTVAWTKEGWEGGDTFVMSNALGSVRFIFRPGGPGTTEFKLPDGSKRTFDRRGVSDSFYWADWNNKAKPSEEIASDLAEQLANVAKRLEFHKSAIPVPQIGFSISPETKAAHLKTLDAGKQISFTPSGFGTGYYLSRKALRFGRSAGAELRKFYGGGPLYVQNFDAD